MQKPWIIFCAVVFCKLRLEALLKISRSLNHHLKIRIFIFYSFNHFARFLRHNIQH